MNIPIKGLIFYDGFDKYLACEECCKSHPEDSNTLQFNENGDLECCSCSRTWSIN